MSRARRRVVFTGPPGAGKTTLLTGMADVGLPVVGEAATDVITRRQSEGIIQPWHELRFTELEQLGFNLWRGDPQAQ